MAQETQMVPYVPWTLALRKEKLEFEPGENTYCALIKPLKLGLATEIATLAKGLQSSDRKNPLGTFAIVEQDEVYLIMNYPKSWETNGLSMLQRHFAKIAIFDEAEARKNKCAGVLLSVRIMHDFLKRRLASADALIYVGANGVRHFSAIHSPLKDDIKLEIMTAWANDDLTGEVEDVIPFAKAFESLIGPYIKTDEKLQDNCIKIFGMWAPNLRTKWYTQPENMHLKAATEPIKFWYQIPPSIRKQLTGRMQSKATDINGNIAEGMCYECSKKIEVCECYCSREHSAINSSELTCACGSKNFTKTIFTYPANCANKTVAGKTSETIQCRDCKAILSVKTPEVKIAPRGAKRSAPPDHVPEWTKRRKK
jgi:hypothetical protein